MPQDVYESPRFQQRLDPMLFFWMDQVNWYAELHESTAPEAIARDQQAAIRPHTNLTVAEISDRVILPASVVRRRLVEMGFLPTE